MLQNKITQNQGKQHTMPVMQDEIYNHKLSVAPMLDWTNSEYSRIRLQLDHNNLNGNTENVWILQYIAAFGAHGAHSF